MTWVPPDGGQEHGRGSGHQRRQHLPEGYHHGYVEGLTSTDGPAGGAARPAHTGISRRTAAFLVGTVALIVVIALLNLVTVPYAVYRPGPVHDTLGDSPDGSPMIAIDGAPTYETSGDLDFTTVSIFGGPRFPVSAWDYLAAHLEPNASIVPEEAVFPEDITPQQIEQQNTRQMQGSQQGAAVVALRALGETVPEEISVVQVMDDAAARGVIEEGDTILGVDGTEATDASMVSELLQEYEAGEEVPIRVERDGEERTLDVPTGEIDGRVVVGVLLQSEFDLPVDVEIDAGNVGGPSAGMMFSLAVYDKLTPGELTGGKQFAGTGTIDSGGEVGPIGGIRQKLAGARDAGAEYFLAPEDNCDEVVGHIPDGLEVASVGTFEDALSVVEAVGSGEEIDLPRC